jgi:hypothetical protein
MRRQETAAAKFQAAKPSPYTLRNAITRKMPT